MSTLVDSIKKEQKATATRAPQLGDYVIVSKPDPGYESSQMIELRKRGYCARINGIGTTITSVMYTRCALLTQNSNFTYSSAALTVISESEANKILAVMSEEAAESLKKSLETIKSIIEQKRLPILSRKLQQINTKIFLATNSNFLKIGNGLNADKTEISNFSAYPHAQCCSVTKTNSHIEVYIPREWMSYFGYNLMDLRLWLSFLSKADIGFNGRFIEAVTLNKVFSNTAAAIPKSTTINSNSFYYPEMEVYKVLIESSGFSMLNYMHFLLVRYMYNHQYWNIPTIALQIKKALKTKISNWECILIAHMYQTYYNYYALTNNQVSTGTSIYEIAVPSNLNSEKNVIARLKNNTNMNSAFSYVNYNTTRIVDALQNKDFDFVLNEVIEWRKK